MKTIVATTLFFLSIISIAQESDSTSLLLEEPKIELDTIVNPDGAADNPQIIYYQTIPEETEDKKSKRRDIRTLSGNMSHSGGFGALSLRSTTFRNETLVLAGLRGGWIINRTLAIGLEGHGIIPTATYEDIDDDVDVVALGGYGGLFLELIFFSNEVVHVTFPVSGGAGWMGYHTDFDEDTFPTPGGGLENNDLKDEDVFWYVEPGASLEVNLSRSFRLGMGVSKRFTQDLELINTKSDAFGKMNYFVTLKIGGF